MKLFGKKKTDDETQVSTPSPDDKTREINPEQEKRKKLIVAIAIIVFLGLLLEGGIFEEEEPQSKKPPKQARKHKAKKSMQQKKALESTEKAPVQEKNPEMIPTVAMEPTAVITPGPLPTAVPDPSPTVVPGPTPTLKVEKEAQPSEKNNELIQTLKEAPALEVVSKEEEIDGDEKEEIIFTPPPNYEKLGRGLVYNCVNQHWACVNRSNYFQCKNNRLWNEKSEKNSQCIEFQVYRSQRDCENKQQQNINMLKNIADKCQK